MKLTKKKKRLLMVIAAGILLVLAAGYTVFIAPLLEEEEWIYKEEQVERGTLKVGVSESGSLEYGITSVIYDLDLDVSDDDDEDDDDEDSDEEAVQKYLKIEEVYVKPGQRIKEGEILYRFAADSVSDVRTLLKSAAVKAQSEYTEALAEYNLSALQAQTDYDSRKLEEEYAASIYEGSMQVIDNETALLEVEINKRLTNIASLQEKVDEAQEDYNEAWEDFKDAEKPPADEKNTVNFMTMQKAYLELQTQYENAKNGLKRAQEEFEENVEKIGELLQDLEETAARKAVNVLEAEETREETLISGEIAGTEYRAELESLKETLQEAEEEKEKIQEQTEAFEAFVGEEGCLYADGEGIVTEVMYEAGDRLQNAGVMLSYAAPDEMTISVDVTQEDIVDLAVGDKVDITFDAYEDVSYGGSIQSINTTATSRESNTVSYTVVVAVEGDTELLFGGMTANIIFVTEEKENVLYISRKAVISENNKTYVYYKTAAGEMALKEVEVGIDNGVDIEILSGLEEGDTIYLASRVSSEDAVMNQEQEENGNAPGDAEFAMPEGEDGMPGDFGGGNMPDEAPGGFGGGNRPGSGMPGGSEGGNMPGGGMPGGSEGRNLPGGGSGGGNRPGGGGMPDGGGRR